MTFSSGMCASLMHRHFILRGPPDTPYEGGEYWGQLLFPEDYPFKPPYVLFASCQRYQAPDTQWPL